MKRNSTSVNTRRLYSGLYQLGHVARCDCDISWGEKIIEVRFKCIWIWQEGVELQVRYWNKCNFSKSMISSLSKPLLPFSRNKSGSDWSFVESFLSSKKSWITFSKAATFSSESKFSAKEFSKSPTNLFMLVMKCILQKKYKCNSV